MHLCKAAVTAAAAAAATAPMAAVVVPARPDWCVWMSERVFGCANGMRCM